jgi:hypothetical protein
MTKPINIDINVRKRVILKPSSKSGKDSIMNSIKSDVISPP